MTVTETKKLQREVERYLAAVEVFRREGCEPRWSDELVVAAQPRRRSAGSRAIPYAA